LSAFSYGDYLDLRARQQVFQDLAGWADLRVSYVANRQGETASAELVSGEYFEVLGVRPVLGRLIQLADDSLSSQPVAVISHRLWQRLFLGDHGAVGQPIRVNGVGYQIVGVAPKEFAGLVNAGLVPSAFWIPMATAARLPAGARNRVIDPGDRSRRWVQVRARLAEGRTLEEAAAQVAAIGAQLDLEHPIDQGGPPGMNAPFMVSRPWIARWSTDISMNEAADRLVKSLASLLMTAVGLVMLVACTTLASLMLTRTASRLHEMSVRLALGASRWRLAREVVTEGLIVVVIGGCVGLAVARVVFVALGNDLPFGYVAPRLDLPVLGVSAGAMLFALLVAGLAPAFRSTRVDVRSALVADGAHLVGQRWRARRLLVGVQVAVSFLLVSVAALCLEQLRVQGSRDTGLELDRLAAAQVDFAAQQYEPGRARQIVDGALEQLARRAGVESVAASSGLPFGTSSPLCRVGAGDQPNHTAVLLSATDGVFQTLGVPMVRGRGFTERDGADAPPVAVIDRRTALRLFEREDAVGRRVVVQRRRTSGDAADHPVVTRTIVGIAGDTDAVSPGVRETGVLYVPLDQHYEGDLVLTARTSGDPSDLVAPIRQAIASMDPELAVVAADVGTVLAGMGNAYLASVSGVSSALGAFTSLLALVGVAGLLLQLVSRRKREIGLRMALGASRRSIIRMVLRDGLGVVARGVIAGFALGVVARLWLRPLFDQVVPTLETWVLIVVPAAMIAAGALSCYLPARQAAGIDPYAALKDL
jgi:predicted permease